MARPRKRSADGPNVSRRHLLLGGAAAVGAAALPDTPLAAATVDAAGALGQSKEQCWGPHQAGVATRSQAFATYLGFAIRSGVARADLVRLMKIWTDDIERMTQGTAVLADPVPELADVPARLTVTVGVGPGLFRTPGLSHKEQPSWLRPLPPFSIDALQAHWSGGDLVVQIAADDPVAVSHARQVLVGDAKAFAEVAWTQTGFHRAAGTTAEGATGRNLMGFIDGTVNPTPGTDDFDQVVWINDGPSWLQGGTGMVLRRIRMNLDTWSGIDRASREQIMGRRLADGSPLTGSLETDAPDLDATTDGGLLTIPEFAHVRVAHARNAAERIYRRPYNYDDGVTGGQPDTGLLFTAFAADIDRQFVPIQRRLDRHDLLNLWTTPIGSSVVAILPGFEPGDWLGRRLLT